MTASKKLGSILTKTTNTLNETLTPKINTHDYYFGFNRVFLNANNQNYTRMVTELETLKAKIQAKGFKVEHYESPMQFNILIQAKNGDHCFARIFTGGNLTKRFAIKNEACLKMQELINQN